MSIDKLTFSVVINTIERANPLRTLLRTLEQQSYPDFEVIVVVGPTHDDTLKILSEYDGRIRVLRCPTVNLSQSRNIGLLASRGDIVVFIDDDALPCQRWLEQYARLFVDPDLDCAGGAVWAAHPKFSMLQFRMGTYSSLSEQVDVRTSLVDQIIPAGKASQWVARIPGGNVAFRRQALLDLRGFDEFYQFVAEEADLTLRLINSGKNIQPVREAVIYHFPASGPNRIAFTSKGRWWMRSRSRIYLGIKNSKAAGETLSNVVVRSVRSLGANLVLYINFFRGKQISFFEYLWFSINEFISGFDAAVHGLFFQRKLIPLEVVAAARSISEPILTYQNIESIKQPAPDPTNHSMPAVSIPEQPLRLCLLSGSYPPKEFGGIARLTNLMAKGLFACGHTVHVITRGDRETVSYLDGAYVHEIPNRLDHYGPYRRYYNLFSTLNYSHNVYEKVQQLVFNDGIQVVDSPFWQYEGLVTLMSGILPVAVRLVTGLRQVNKIHKNQVDEFTLMGDLEQAFIDRAHYLLPNTQATFDAMHHVYDFKAAGDRFTVVPYGIIPAPDDQIQPYKPKANGEPLTILFVGRLEKRKGIFELFEAIPQVLKQFPNVKFILAGADNSQNDGFKLSAGMDYPTYFSRHYPQCLPMVEFKGLVSDELLQSLYRSCDLFVAPSLYESFGLIYLEAMNFAKPVIGCKAGGIPEVVDHGVTGILVEPGAAPPLVEAIVSMLKSPEKMREMGLAGRAQILDRFNYITMARAFAQVYRQMIQTFNIEMPRNN